jgi:hypothetical protein
MPEPGSLARSDGPVKYSGAMRPSTIVTLLAAVLFAGFLLYSTMASQRVECLVAVEYQGRRNEATASAATEREAVQQAQTTACGPVAAGMNETIACTNRPPVRRQCRTL